MSTEQMPFRAPGGEGFGGAIALPAPLAEPGAAQPATSPPLAGAGTSGTSAAGARRSAHVALTRLIAWPEVYVVLGVAAVLNLWNLQINGWANTYYAAAVRSMSASWHNFLFASMDPSGLMTVDKPPLAVWVQALSARIFGYHSLEHPDAAGAHGGRGAGLMYDLVRRRFGRFAGFIAGIALATTPTIVAVSRHNNPDELLVLLSVVAVWCALRALETGRTRWLVWCGLAVGLGFETKMGVALMIVPAIAAAWVWMRWQRGGGVLRRNLRMLGQLLWGGLAMLVAGCAWPVLVTLTPAADRPWISGTADNSIWSLIFNYNGLGRIAGQTGGPGGGTGTGAFGGGGSGGSLFGGSTGIFRLLQSGLGDQAGWLLGSALVAGVALLVLTRLRRSDPRSGFLIVLGGSLLTIGVVFSFASGIFHPYYVSMVAPWAAALLGAGAGEMLTPPLGVARSARSARLVGPAVIIGGAITELVVLGELGGQLAWARPLVIVAAVGGGVLMALRLVPRARPRGRRRDDRSPVRSARCVGVRDAVLRDERDVPHRWSPERRDRRRLRRPRGLARRHRLRPRLCAARRRLRPAHRHGQWRCRAGRRLRSAVRWLRRGRRRGRRGRLRRWRRGRLRRRQLDAHRRDQLRQGARRRHDRRREPEQRGRSDHLLERGRRRSRGFSGRESSVSVAWIASEVRSGRLRWLLAEGQQSARLAGDTRSGSASAISTAESAGRRVTFTVNGTTVTMYDLRGRAAAILAAAR